MQTLCKLSTSGRNNKSSGLTMKTMGMTICIWIVVGLVCMTTVADASCNLVHSVMVCVGEFPELDNANAHTPALDLIINSYAGSLSTSREEGPHDFFPQSIQFNRGSIKFIQKGFFSRLSGSRLKQLTLTEVAGSYEMDSNTLDGLSNSMESLRVTKHPLNDISGLASLRKLTDLTLFQTSLKQLPSNFKQVIQTVTRLDLSGNQLKSFPWDVLAQRIQEQQFISITLKSNPLHCDCSLKPVLEAGLQARNKINGFKCETPQELSGLKLDTLSVRSVCPAGSVIPEKDTGDSKESNKGKPDRKPQTGDGGDGGDDGDSQKGAESASSPDRTVATAGSMSTEMIVAVVVVVVIVGVVVLAVIVYVVRQRSQARSSDGSRKNAAHKSNSYCAVIENPDEPGCGKNNAQPRDVDQTERQPLNPPYSNRNYPDHRL